MLEIIGIPLGSNFKRDPIPWSDPNQVVVQRNSQIEHEIRKPYQSDFSEISIDDILQSDILKTLPYKFTEFEFDKMDIPFSKSEIKLLGELTQQYNQGKISDTEFTSKILNLRGGIDSATYMGIKVICYFFLRTLGASKTEAFTLTHMLDRCAISHSVHSSMAKAHRNNAEQNRNANCQARKMTMNSPKSNKPKFGKSNSIIAKAADGGQNVVLNNFQYRDKANHADVWKDIELPETFDLPYVKRLDYKSRLEYVRNPNNLPEETVFEMQMEAKKFYESPDTKAFPGTLGRNKIKETLYIQESTGTVGFVNDSDSESRTNINMSERQLERLRNRDYHLFPNV